MAPRDFEWALGQMKKGKSVMREISRGTGDNVSFSIKEIPNGTKDVNGYPTHIVVKKNGKSSLAELTNESILATDWVLVDEE